MEPLTVLHILPLALVADHHGAHRFLQQKIRLSFQQPYRSTTKNITSHARLTNGSAQDAELAPPGNALLSISHCPQSVHLGQETQEAVSIRSAFACERQDGLSRFATLPCNPISGLHLTYAPDTSPSLALRHKR